MSTAPSRRCAIYARISVTKDESVSIERTIEACEQYAAAYGWQVVEIFTDDGVSASDNRPEDRPGWRRLMAYPEPVDTVIVWKVDRLARRLTDFWATYATLQEQGRSLVSVEERLDMTTAMGRTFAGIIAGFAEQEAETISLRVAAARQHLIRHGRVVGGTVPYGWKSTPNPAGPGFVLAQDPDRIGYVRGMAERALRGDSIYSITKWLSESDAPLPSASQKNRKRGEWSYTTVQRLLTNPVLAGMAVFNPGNSAKARGEEVLRGDDGLPVVDEAVAIMPLEQWRTMLRQITERDNGHSRARALRAKTSGLLSGLVTCAMHDGETVRMWRNNVGGRQGYYCPQCRQTITNFEDVVIDEFLRLKGDRVRWSVVEEVHEGGAAVLPEIEHRLAELTAQLQATDDDVEADSLTRQISSLRTMRREARAMAPNVVLRPVRHTQSFGEDWAAADGVEEQRAVLDDALLSVNVARGRPGRRTAESVLERLTLEWKMPNDTGPDYVPTDAELAEWAR